MAQADERRTGTTAGAPRSARGTTAGGVTCHECTERAVASGPSTRAGRRWPLLVLVIGGVRHPVPCRAAPRAVGPHAQRLGGRHHALAGPPVATARPRSRRVTDRVLVLR